MTFPVFPGSNPSGYNLTRSIRLRASASATLTRTFGSTFTDKTKWTMSFWVKRGKLNDGAGQIVMHYLSGGSGGSVGFSGAGGGGSAVNDDFVIGNRNATTGVGDYNIRLLRLFRDPSAWYHIVVKFDSTQATASNRVLIYVNGEQQSGFGADTAYPALNYQSTAFLGGTAVAHQIGYGAPSGAPSYFDGYFAEFYWIDGQALTASSFGTTNTLTGVWQPAPYTGTYGANGFYTPYSDNSALTTSSNAGLGKDFSGNGNYWTTNNISITAGVTYDSMTDVPTLTSATAANFAVLNPLNYPLVAGGIGNLVYSNANLTLTSTPGNSQTFAASTIAMSSGKFYCEYVFTNMTSDGNIGVWLSQITNSDYWYNLSGCLRYYSGGTVYLGASTSVASYNSYGTNDIIGVAVDLNAGKIYFSKNGTWQGSSDPAAGTNPAYSSLSGTYVFGFGSGGGINGSFTANFGQRPFAYTPPTGFVALNTYNLPTSTIVAGNKYMDATLYTGNSSTQNIVNAGGFKPDFVWMKNRTSALAHYLNDSVRGAYKTLFSNLTNAEYDGTSNSDGVSTFNSNGFTLLNGTNALNYNQSANNYVAWQWQAGQGTTSSNTSGTITSTVSVNASAGFSIVVYTGNGTNGATVGHGLGVKPSLIIEKGRSTTYNWSVQGCGVLWPTATQTLFLNGTNALNAGSGVAAPTSSVFTPSATLYANESGVSNVAYCWTPIAGYSAFGSYTGNGSTDGPMIYTGFKPRFLLIKKTATGGGDRGWLMEDTARSPYNAAELFLYANTSDAESNNQQIDFLSNGFKIRNNGLVVNDSGVTMIYAAFAENPFKNSLAR